MASGSMYRGHQKGRCTKCPYMTVETLRNGKTNGKYCHHYKNWSMRVAWNCTKWYLSSGKGLLTKNVTGRKK